MTELARPRFYVAAVTGYSMEATASSRPATSYVVLDRLWAFREVYADLAIGGAKGGLPDTVRRARAEAYAERANARHEQHMREVA